MSDNTTLTIYRMVLNRLPFFADTPKNITLVDDYTLEIMHELETCFRVDEGLSPADPTRVGNEEHYSIPQRAIIADLVCVYILMFQMLGNMAGNNNGSDLVVGSNKFLKKAEAGSVNVEWEQFDVNKGSGLLMSGEKLLMMYKKSAIRKARVLGCIIDVCDDCSLAVELMMNYEVQPFKIVTVGGCGISSNVPERS